MLNIKRFLLLLIALLIIMWISGKCAYRRSLTERIKVYEVEFKPSDIDTIFVDGNVLTIRKKDGSIHFLPLDQ